MSTELNFKARREADGRITYVCACGSDMWDNSRKKTSEKAPDLKCKASNCTCGRNGQPNAVWLTKGQRAQYRLAYRRQAEVRRGAGEHLLQRSLII